MSHLVRRLLGDPTTTAGYAAWSPDAAALAVTALDRRSA